MASDYADDHRQPRAPRRDHHRAPYPDYGPDFAGMDDYGADARGRPAPRADDPHAADLPPPPLGETLKPALKREGSRSRVSPDTRPQFEDGVSALGRGPPDLERKNRPRDKEFRDRRDGYESDEGDAHKASKYTPAGGRNRRDRGGARDPQPPYPDSMVGSRRGGDPYDDAPPPRRRRDPDPYEDDYAPPRRRRDDPPVQYGSDPVPARRRSSRPPPRRGDRYDDYSDDDDYDRRPRRRRSHDDARRRPREYDDDRYHSDEPRRRRDDDYDRPRRRDRSRRRDDDYDDYDSRVSRGDRDRRRDDRQPKEIKIGKYDIGPWVEKGQKHWVTLAPILTPIVMNLARKHMGGGSSGGGRGSKR
ncbi:uncharacterized protein MYCFIDRAFT_213714 [Pseudocercospora fijiensis CIRAD86]|uniref:Uncharacterized protein n=1 Tax=Pseudocercospora fijiensis (strain CIRAD86) TaxID=383855 RepID=N1Q9I9_PSEFD|nr:uncharacterized protein MYCFIDRAFT_213714 [Pseudocercospora fijiensis CIRAD86]EME89539.1 hypothetical protein MYCFIDRAFT_213714 [Pseudocercospora fijiensis CIRAD86]